MKKFNILVFVFLISSTLWGQLYDNYADELLTRTFKSYREVDLEISYHLFPFVKERFLEHLADTTSFSNPFDSLSKYINIDETSDGLVKTYS